jgi:hypothetical protein
MSWAAITADEVLQEWNEKEQLKVQEQQAAADNLPDILVRVVNACRGCVRAGGGQVGPAGTIPDQLREEVIAIARWRLLLALPDVSDAILSKSREKAHDDAVKRFDAVAAGDIKVELPEVQVAAPAPVNAVEVASKQDRVATREKLDGV